MAEQTIEFDIKNVTKQFMIKRKKIQALSEINLQIRKNEFVAILGTSGCGKSTLLRMLCGLDKPTTGNILSGGLAVTGPGPDRGMVFQAYTLFPWMTNLDNVAYGLKQKKLPKNECYEKAQEFIDVVGLNGFEDAYPKALSGGMKQRVALARALANNPQSLLLDEPFGALDMQTRGTMQELTLQIWSRYPKTVVMVTHDIEEAVFMADRVIVMNSHPGSIKEILNIELPRPRGYEIKNHPKFIEYKRYATQLIYEESLKSDMELQEG